MVSDDFLGIPNVYQNEFIISLPCDIRPRNVIGGYDYMEEGSFLSFMVHLLLDWRNDAPQIQQARLQWYNGTLYMVPIPRDHIFLRRGGPFSDPDVLDGDEGGTLICDVLVRPLVK